MAGITGPAHFIHLGGDLCWQHERAIQTAHIHDTEVWLWSVPGYQVEGAEFFLLDLPEWLRDHPIQLANVKDLYAWQVLHEYGGIYLDLDTISLRAAWDLLPEEADVLVSTECPPTEHWDNPYNSAVVIGREGAPVLARLAEDAYAILRSGEARWGKTGPHLLTDFVARWDGAIAAAPFPALNGWSYHDIGDYYRHPRDPGEYVRVIHLYASDHQSEFLGDQWMPRR